MTAAFVQPHGSSFQVRGSHNESQTFYATSIASLRQPRQEGSSPVSLDILDLLAHALEFTLDLDHAVGDGRIVAFRADSIDFAVHFLHQKFDFAAHRFSS